MSLDDEWDCLMNEIGRWMRLANEWDCLVNEMRLADEWECPMNEIGRWMRPTDEWDDWLIEWWVNGQNSRCSRYWRIESHHTADDGGVLVVPVVVTDGPPLTVSVHLHVALSCRTVNSYEHVTRVKVHRGQRRHACMNDKWIWFFRMLMFSQGKTVLYSKKSTTTSVS